MEDKYQNDAEYVPCKGDVFSCNGITYICKGVSKDKTKLRIVGQSMSVYANTSCSTLIRKSENG